MKRFILILGILALGAVFVACGGNNTSEEDFVNMEEVGFFEHFGIFNPTNILIAMNGEYIQTVPAPQLINGQIYLPANFLRQQVDRYIFWEADSNRLSISNYQEIHRFTPDATTFTVNFSEQPLATPIRRVGDMAFLSMEMVSQRYYAFNFDFQPEYNILIVTPPVPVNIYRVEMETEGYDDLYSTPLRTGAGLQHPILAHVNAGDHVTMLNNVGNNFTRVMLSNGLMGYVQRDTLDPHSTSTPIPFFQARRPITRPSFDGSINMAWHLVTSPAAASNQANWYTMRGVNAISPTWLYFCRPSMDGTIINFGNREYVQWAHANGMEVWPMISDAFFTAGAAPELFSNEAARLVLMDAEIRDFVIAQIMDMVHRYNWDGINIDYEAWTVAEVDHFIQFLRELSVPMRQAGAVLSVAVFNPLNFNFWRNYQDTAATVDFLVTMSYDEHYLSARTAGSVSSFPFVQSGVLNLLDWGVPAEQIVIGLPTYMRVWTEQFNMSSGEWELLPGGTHPEFYPYRRVRDVGMQFGYNIMRGMGGEFEWDYILRQYVAVVYHEHGGVELRTSAWLNCLRSTGEKMSLINQHNLGGVAWWQKGLELPALWEFADNLLQ
ncbi:MAG: glycosyl hydrolase family 18 protein [Defluviitaleaceae bacterium]|nr:glycosyl hydrolase family 18 protein [Defluviitaleaceae bacterium]